MFYVLFFRRCRIDLSKMTHEYFNTYTRVCVESRHENEKCVPWQWESFEGFESCRSATHLETLLNKIYTHKRHRFYPSWKLFDDSWKNSSRFLFLGGGGGQNRILILSRWIFNATSKMYKIFIQVAKNYCKLYTYTGALLLCAIIFGYKMWCRRIFNVVPFHDALRYS